jgi:hypothetical protein
MQFYIHEYGKRYISPLIVKFVHCVAFFLKQSRKHPGKTGYASGHAKEGKHEI